MDIWEFCKENICVSIYGCGRYGHILKNKLEDRGIKVDSFILSDDNKKPEENSQGLPVFHLSEWTAIYSYCRAGILISVSEEYQKEILLNLKAKGIENYFLVSNQIFDIKKIGIMDSTVGACNHGNEIIMQAVNKYLLPKYEKDFVFRFPFFDEISQHSIQYMKRCRYLFLGGTNALNSEMDVKKYIGVNEKDIGDLKNKIILMGVGWLRYEDNPNRYTQNILSKILNREIFHSVRDSYTEKKLRAIGINNVLNTGCPTIWGLTKEHCSQIPTRKADEVIVMLTPGYTAQNEKLLEIVKNSYKKIYFWVQSDMDYGYIRLLCPDAIQIPSQLEKLEQFLTANEKIDYVGTRLHGGIKCLQHKKRTIILAIDNRASEMKKDFNLPVILPEDVEKLNEAIHGEYLTDIHIPEENIEKWVQQFG